MSLTQSCLNESQTLAAALKTITLYKLWTVYESVCRFWMSKSQQWHKGEKQKQQFQESKYFMMSFTGYNISLLLLSQHLLWQPICHFEVFKKCFFSQSKMYIFIMVLFILYIWLWWTCDLFRLSLFPLHSETHTETPQVTPVTLKERSG